MYADVYANNSTYNYICTFFTMKLFFHETFQPKKNFNDMVQLFHAH